MTWNEMLAAEFSQPYFIELKQFVENEYATSTIYPAKENIFRALRATPYEAVKVVILGQDPYHGDGQADGLAFSVPNGVAYPPSLRNILQELRSDLGIETPKQQANLLNWATQGVLLLNSVLTVRANTAGSHANKGWERLTDAIIALLANHKQHLVFILWGRYAQDKGRLIDRNRHCVIESAHPSPLSASRGFFGSRCFSRANAYLEGKGKEGIMWGGLG